MVVTIIHKSEWLWQRVREVSRFERENKDRNYPITDSSKKKKRFGDWIRELMER